MGVGLGNLPRAGNDFRPIRVGSLPESEEQGLTLIYLGSLSDETRLLLTVRKRGIL